jgi:imidazolonepropionase-like amidohydrolase
MTMSISAVAHEVIVQYQRRTMVRQPGGHQLLAFLAVCGLSSPALSNAQAAADHCAIAIVGATVIDGNGGEPLRKATVLVRGDRIEAVGSQRDVAVPDCARRIDGAGKYVTPGFIDTNVHFAMPRTPIDYARYFDKLQALAIEGAQLSLKYGVTSVRDSYGVLKPLLAARDAVNRGEAVGSRMLVAGNIVGWGGQFSRTFRGRPPEGYFEEWVNDEITQGSGEMLSWKSPAELRVAINKYMDLGVDFVKIGVTDHDQNWPVLMFSQRQLDAMVEEIHRRGLVAEVHATSPEGLMMAMQSGVDLIQHPEVIGAPITDEILQRLDQGKFICSVHANNHAGRAWQAVLRAEAVKQKDEQTKEKDTSELRHWPKPALTQWKLQQKLIDDNSRMFRANAEKILKTRCVVTAATDNAMGGSPEFEQDPNQWHAREPGVGTLASIEGLVELGMSPLAAITAGTKNGALALRQQGELGVIEPKRRADLVLLDADPVQDIKNIRRIHMLLKDGQIIDRDKLPREPVYYRPAPQPAPTPSDR